MSNSPELFLYRNPRIMTLALVLIFAAGVCAYISIPKLEDPKSEARFAYVITRMRGATASRVESQVTKIVEDQIRREKEVKTITSDSRDSVSWIGVYLKDETEDVDKVWSRIQNRIDEAKSKLPNESSDPELVRTVWDSYAVIYGLKWIGRKSPNRSQLKRYADELQQRIQYVSGTKNSRSFGVNGEEVLVEVDPFEITSLGISYDDLSSAIALGDSKVVSGIQHSDENQILMEVMGGVKDIERLGAIPIHSSKLGSNIYLRDIARIKKTVQEPLDSCVLINSSQGVAVAARAFSDLQMDSWVEAINESVSEFKKTLPREIELVEIFSQKKYTDLRWGFLRKNLVFGFISVALATWLMMGFRAAIPIVLALPLTICTALIFMALFEVSLHQVSFIGIVIALGLLIDNPIIVVDELQQRKEDTEEAIRASSKLLTKPLIGAVSTTALAFCPMMLIQGPTGEYLWTLGAAVVLCVIASLFISLWIIPGLSAAIGVVGVKRQGPLARPFVALTGALTLVALRLPKTTILLLLAIAAFGFFLAGLIPENFFPPAERDLVRLTVRMQRSTKIDQTLSQVTELDDMLVNDPGIANTTWFIGSSVPQFYYNIFSGEDSSPFLAECMVQLDSSSGIPAMINRLQEKMNRSFPEVHIVMRQLEQGPGVFAPIEIRLFGNDLIELAEHGEFVRRILGETPGVIQTESTIDLGVPKMAFNVNEERAAPLGLSATNVARQLEIATVGVTAGTLLEDSEELPIRVRFDRRYTKEWPVLLSIPLSSNKENDSPTILKSVAENELLPEVGSITRRNGQRCNTIRGYLLAGTLPSRALQSFNLTFADLSVATPTGIRMEFGGEAEERSQTVNELATFAIVILVLLLAALVWACDSFRLAGVVAMVALMSAGFAIITLYFSGYPFGMMAIIGLLGMVGIAVNDSVVVIAALNDHRGGQSRDLTEIHKVTKQASLHVLTTTLTTTAGFLPLLLSGSEFWGPVAVVMIGGVFSATVLSLLFVPVSFMLTLKPSHSLTPNTESIGVSWNLENRTKPPEEVFLTEELYISDDSENAQSKS